MNKSDNIKPMYKKKILLIVLIILIFIGLYFLVLDDYVKAYQKGVSVKYFQDDRYCEQDSDCVQFITCGEAVNIYNDKPEDNSCKIVPCGPNICSKNTCVLNCSREVVR